MQSIPFLDLDRQHAELRPELLSAFERVTRTSAFILGEEVERFEDEFARFCGVEHCIGTASGTAALTIALIAAGIGPGDEVIVPAHTFVSSAFAVVHAGASPVLCDVEEGTGLIDITSAEAVSGERTAAIVAVHLYGQLCDMEAVNRFARARGLLVLEDAAQAHGATAGARKAGALGTAAGFSFYPSKNLGALGDAGAITTSDAQIAERARRLRNLGQRGKDGHVDVGFNERLDGLQAAVLRIKLPRLEKWNEQRRRRAATYTAALDGAVRLLDVAKPDSCVYHLFPVRVREREGLRRSLADAGIETGIHYPAAVHQQAALRETCVVRSGLPVAESWAAEELSLPIYPGLGDAGIERVSALCRGHLAPR
jgi:dTDP-3-amino-3,4,6-trideoxy-alpha-D-glucose transaminase